MNGQSEIEDATGPSHKRDPGLTETPVIDRIPRLRPGKKPKKRKPPRPTLETPRTQILLPQTRTGWLKVGGALAGIVIVVAAALTGVRFISHTGCQEFTTDITTVEAGGLKINVLPGDLVGSFGVKLSVLSPSEFGSAANLDIQAASAAVPQHLTPSGNFVAVKTCSVNPKNITLRVAAPADAQSLDTFDLYGWNSQSRAWRWLGGETDMQSREIVAYTNEMPTGLMLMKTASAPLILGVDAPASSTSPTTWLPKVPQGAAEISVPAMTLGDLGRVNVTAATLPATGNTSAKVIPAARNWSANGEVNRMLLRTMLSSAAMREAHIGQMISAMNATGYEAIEIDYRGVDPAQSQNFAAFIEALAHALGERGKSLTVVVPSPTMPADASGTLAAPVTPGYDLRRIGSAAAQVKLDLSANPALMVSGELRRVVSWVTGQINRYKLQLVVPTLGVRQDANGRFSLITLEDALASLAPLSVEQPLARPDATVQLRWRAGASPAQMNYDAATSAYSFSYIDERGVQQTVWPGTAASLKRVLGQLIGHNVRGVTLRGAMVDGNDEGIRGIVEGFLRGDISTAHAPEPKLKIAFGTGTPFTLPLSAVASKMEVQTPGGEGNYTVRSVFESARQVAVSSTRIQISKDAPPTNGRADTVTASTALTTTTTAPAMTGAMADPKQAQPAAANGVMTGAKAGAKVDVFELGGVVADQTHVTQMLGAGMTWVKTESQGFEVPDAFIVGAKAKGMKVLVTAIGDRMRVMDEGYRNEWVQHLGRLAALGVDAIEVWSAPNYDGDWPTGQINGATYVDLLKRAHAVIKQSNPGTLVISAALAESAGAFSGGCNEQGCDELAFLGQMAAAGAQDAMDCIGIHYTTGHEAPSAVGANHYSWYYEPLRDAYYGAFNGAKPVCFTALGYVSAEGYPSGMPGNYSFATGTTVANHAAWLADAAKMSRDSGKVRLMIVWNVDATEFRAGDNGDPAAGYAMIRPDGTCPACESLRTAMGSQ